MIKTERHPRRDATRRVTIAGLLAIVLAAPSATAAGTTELVRLASTPIAADDALGTSVATDGVYAVLGADQTLSAGTGAAYVFQQDLGGVDNWGQLLPLAAIGLVANDQFGFDVAISGDVIVVGTPGDDDAGANAGAAYLFGRDVGGPDNWGQITKLIGDDVGAADGFGNAVAVDGDTVVVAAPFSEAAGANTGAAYVFQRDVGGPDNWGQVTRLNHDTPLIGDQFSRNAVDISGDLVVVGARFDDDDGGSSGSAFLFDRNLGGADAWGQVTRLAPDDPAGGKQFGVSVAVDDDRVIVGAWGDASFTGAAYVFDRDEDGPDAWGQVIKLTPAGGVANDIFGVSVDVEGEVALVGAPENDSPPQGPGTAFMYASYFGGEGNWGELAQLDPTVPENRSEFGAAVALFGGRALVGAPADDDDADDAGAGFIFEVAVIPTPFNLIAPVPGTYVQTKTPTLTWEPSQLNEDGYTLLLDDDADLSSPIIMETGLVGESYVVPNGAINGGVFYWRVTASNLQGTTTANPNPGDFAVVIMNASCPGDIDGDGVVNTVDLLMLLGAWGLCP